MVHLSVSVSVSDGITLCTTAVKLVYRAHATETGLNVYVIVYLYRDFVFIENLPVHMKYKV